MDKFFVPLKEGRRANGAGQAPQNYMCASRIPKKKFVAKQFASAEICREAICLVWVAFYLFSETTNGAPFFFSSFVRIGLKTDIYERKKEKKGKSAQTACGFRNNRL
jgi:hypothetical protein